MAKFSIIKHDYPTVDETEAEFDAAVMAIKERCALSKLEIIEDSNVFMYSNEYTIKIPQGRGHREVNIWNASQARAIEAIAFENVKFIAGYHAIYVPADNLIEVLIRPANISFYRHIRSRIFPDVTHKHGDNARQHIVVDDEHGHSISLGQASPTFYALLQSYMSPESLTLTLKGFGCATHEIALSTLERISDTYLLQFDFVTGIAFGLGRTREYTTSSTATSQAVHALESMVFPSLEYDHAPASLYRYGRSASSMPLLQYLAYYQVVEFYFPTYSDLVARKKVRNILKDPAFRPDREADINQLLRAAQPRTMGYVTERAQLKSTISECVDKATLIEFIEKDASRADFFKNPNKKSRHTKLSILDSKAEIIDELADRIYDIRCEIVHTKEAGGGNGNQSRILPYSAEADQLEHDISVMQYVAQRVLIASSQKL